jgi:hypothetical protein
MSRKCGSCAHWTRTSGSTEQINRSIETYKEYAKKEEEEAGALPSGEFGFKIGHSLNAARIRMVISEKEFEINHPYGQCQRFPKAETKRSSDTCGEWSVRP